MALEHGFSFTERLLAVNCSHERVKAEKYWGHGLTDARPENWTVQ